MGTFILAALGVALALASLLWQAISWLLSGSRVSVEIARTLSDPEGDKSSIIGASTDAKTLAFLRNEGFTEPRIMIRVFNRGRGPSEIEQVGIVGPTGDGLVGIFDPPLPCRIDGETSMHWHIDVSAVERWAHALAALRATAAPEMVEIRAQVTLGTGKEIKSKSTLIFPDDLIALRSPFIKKGPGP